MHAAGSTDSSTSNRYRPPFVVIDFETELDGVGSTDFWHPGFRVVSMAASWLAADGAVTSEFIEGENACFYFLERLAREQLPLVAHNVQFEMGVARCRFPELRLPWVADTMRLVQCHDNGGPDAFIDVPASLDDELDAAERGEEGGDEREYIGGLGLAVAVRRVLGEADSHKAEAYQWLRASGVKKGQEGKHLGRLPVDLLRRYNIGDTEATLRLYRFLLDRFAAIGYDWRLDHHLYFSSVRRLVDAKIRGVAVDRESLQAYAETVRVEIAEIGETFRRRYAAEVAAVERRRLLDEVRERKTLRGRKGFLRRYRGGAAAAVKAVRFNVGSNLQLAALFVDHLGMEPKFRTDKGAPSFRSAVLDQWGEGGGLLKKRRKRLLVLKQAESLLELSSVDGRWHLSLKACGTATGRFSGGN